MENIQLVLIPSYAMSWGLYVSHPDWKNFFDTFNRYDVRGKTTAGVMII